MLIILLFQFATSHYNPGWGVRYSLTTEEAFVVGLDNALASYIQLKSHRLISDGFSQVKRINLSFDDLKGFFPVF